MRGLFKLSNVLLLASFLSGALLLAYSNHLSLWRSDQFYYYNRGIAAYKADDVRGATALFELSLAAYNDELKGGRWHKLVYPSPSRELAALAYFYKGRLFLKGGQLEAAVESFKDSLRLNSGENVDLLGPADSKRLAEQALVVKYDLEILMKTHPQLGEVEGMGKDRKGADKDDEQVPKMAPGGQPGKGGKDDI